MTAADDALAVIEQTATELKAAEKAVLALRRSRDAQVVDAVARGASQAAAAAAAGLTQGRVSQLLTESRGDTP